MNPKCRADDDDDGCYVLCKSSLERERKIKKQKKIQRSSRVVMKKQQKYARATDSLRGFRGLKKQRRRFQATVDGGGEKSKAQVGGGGQTYSFDI